MNIYNFAKLSLFQQVTILKTDATLIDDYIESNDLVLVYSLNGFFIEATIDSLSETISEITPFKRGFLSDKRYVNDQWSNFDFPYAMVA